MTNSTEIYQGKSKDSCLSLCRQNAGKASTMVLRRQPRRFLSSGVVPNNRLLYQQHLHQHQQWCMHDLAHQGYSGDTSHALLQDVAIRLQGQQARLLTLQQELQGENCNKEQPLIRAVNQPILNWTDWKYQQQQQHEQQEQQHDQQQDGNRTKAINDACKAIHNLQVLHTDTCRLSWDLLGQQHVFSKFNNAHQHLLKATMEQIRSRHASTVEVMADVTLSTRPYYTIPTLWMDSFLASRLGIQLLCDHAVKLPKKSTGGISVNCELDGVIMDAVTEAKHMVDAHLPSVPTIVLPDTYPHITLIRPWVHHALVELFKNSMAACVKRGRTTEQARIMVDIHESDAEIQIHIHDQGQGVADIPKAFVFATSNDLKRWDRLEEQMSYAMVRSPLSSLGVGLPLSRSMMRHFGGDVLLTNRTEPTDRLQTGATATIILPKDDRILERRVEDRV